MGTSCGTMNSSIVRRDSGNGNMGSNIIFVQAPYDPNLKVEDIGLKNVLTDFDNLIAALQQLQGEVIKIPSKINEIQIQ
ncbi:unnamed protein product [Paramecium sonneborni]|uniref:Uncharacterized protein n=1 Tax=Paramecium sonneborni TaxID=65129 RepID=A0A8S1NY52_9CILI|nr:unnamed protein product [Paramecium sonneborni]CAD8095351.1 unnamed protein product [Paramecium sonneborni]